MAHRQEEAENHWPGFVDALATIVMVVTFLLIILGVVIFIIAQQIQVTAGNSQKETQQKEQFFKKPTPEMVKQENIETYEAIDDKVASDLKQVEIAKAQAATAQAEAAKAAQIVEQLKVQTAKAHAEAEHAKTQAAIAQAQAAQMQAQAARDDAKSASDNAKAEQIKLEIAKVKAAEAKQNAKIAEAIAEAEQTKLETAKVKTAQQKMQIEQKEKLDAQFKINLVEELRQNHTSDKNIDGQKVRSQKIADEKQIAIASDEITNDIKGNIVLSANAILTLIFDGKSVVIDKKSSEEIQLFLTEKSVTKLNNIIEIRSYVNLNGASMGERRRMAFYRAMAARNELLQLGITPVNISVKVKEVDDDGLEGKLKIFIKPSNN